MISARELGNCRLPLEFFDEQAAAEVRSLFTDFIRDFISHWENQP
jgi:hypothetical protein